MLAHVMSGVSLALRERRLVLLLWWLHLGLALIVAVPFWLWGRGAFGTSVEAQVLAGGFDFAVFADLMEESSPAIVAFALATFTTLAIAALGAAFVSSGVLAVVIARTRPVDATGTAVPRRTVMSLFFEGGGRFFWRNLGLMLATALVFVPFVGIPYGIARAATSPLESSLSEAGAWTRAFAPPLVGGVALLLLVLVLDFARIGVVAGDRRGTWRTWLTGARFVARHLASSLGLWVVFALSVAVAAGVYLWLRGAMPAGSWAAILAMVLLQQAFVLWRTTMKVALTAGQMELATELRMPGLVEEPVVPVPQPAEEVSPSPDLVLAGTQEIGDDQPPPAPQSQP
jgi:hypothetical protein